MSNIGYFITSPVILPRARYQAPCYDCGTWVANVVCCSSTTVFYYECDGFCTQSSFVIDPNLPEYGQPCGSYTFNPNNGGFPILEYTACDGTPVGPLYPSVATTFCAIVGTVSADWGTLDYNGVCFCNCNECGDPASASATLDNQNTSCTPPPPTTTTTTTAPPTTTTTTTIDCNQTYSIDVYGRSNKDCELCLSCEIGECAECDSIVLEYSTDNGTNWNNGGIYFDTVSNACTFLGTFTVGVCETTLIFRIISANRCGGPIYFEYNANSTTCPVADKCGNCTQSETTNVMPTGNTSIAFAICTECFNNCCSCCCV